MSDLHPETFGAYARRCWIVFGAVVLGTLLMVAASYMPLGNKALSIGLVLMAACVNAFMVAGYLMHLISERKTIYALLAFTAVFFVGLMGLTMWATHDMPIVLKP